MNLRTFVIANNIKNLTDARYCAGMGVPYIGFNLDVRGLDDITFIAITEWISGCTIVGEFHSTPIEQIKEKIESLKLTHVLSSSLETLEGLSGLGVELILQSETHGLTSTGPVELSYTISPKSNDLPIGNSKFILGGDIRPENLDDIVNNSSIQGIAIEGGDEERPGFKDMDALADILEALDEEY